MPKTGHTQRRTNEKRNFLPVDMVGPQRNQRNKIIKKTEESYPPSNRPSTGHGEPVPLTVREVADPVMGDRHTVIESGRRARPPSVSHRPERPPASTRVGRQTSKAPSGSRSCSISAERTASSVNACSLCPCVSRPALNLAPRDRLTEHAAPAELAQAGQRIRQPVDGSKRIELIHDEPEPVIPFPETHRLKDRKPHPDREDRPERRDLIGLIRQEQYPTASFHPLAHREPSPWGPGIRLRARSPGSSRPPSPSMPAASADANRRALARSIRFRSFRVAAWAAHASHSCPLANPLNRPPAQTRRLKPVRSTLRKESLLEPRQAGAASLDQRIG